MASIQFFCFQHGQGPGMSTPFLTHSSKCGCVLQTINWVKFGWWHLFFSFQHAAKTYFKQKQNSSLIIKWVFLVGVFSHKQNTGRDFIEERGRKLISNSSRKIRVLKNLWNTNYSYCVKKYWSSLKEIATINVFIFPYYICQ